MIAGKLRKVQNSLNISVSAFFYAGSPLSLDPFRSPKAERVYHETCKFPT